MWCGRSRTTTVDLIIFIQFLQNSAILSEVKLDAWRVLVLGGHKNSSITTLLDEFCEFLLIAKKSWQLHYDTLIPEKHFGG